MAITEICNLCKTPGTIKNSIIIKKIKCNVRAYNDTSFTYWRCSGCQSLHCLEDANLDDYYRKYPMQFHTLDFWTRKSYANILNRLSLAGLKRDMSIIDYGCGEGLLLKYLSEKNFLNLSGYDPHTLKYSNDLVHSKTYDCVISQDSIEHSENPVDFFSKLVSLVAPSGMIVIGTQNGAKVDLKKPEVYSLSLHAPYHRHLLSIESLMEIARNQGFIPVAKYSRFYYDTLWPTVNYRFLRRYIRLAGNILDAAFEPPKIGLVLTSPTLWFFAIFGYFFPPRSEMMIIFRRK